ncbi:MAG: class I SAM-dependent methyltransferase, partial [Cyanobium sp.]
MHIVLVVKSLLRKAHRKLFLEPVSLLVGASFSDGNISKARERIATQETAMYVNERLSHVSPVDTCAKVHDIAIASICDYDGMILEFGVYTGRTLNYIARSIPDKIVDGFDSFDGLPEFWRDGFGKGHFAVDHLPPVELNVRLHTGWFEDSLPEFLGQMPLDKAVAYLHVDCDLYSSAKTIFDALSDRITSGTIIVFDEYFNYPGWRQGEFKAFQEFTAIHGRS